MSNSIALEWTPADAPRQRLVFTAKDTNEWVRLVMEDQDGTWQVTSQEVVTDIDLEPYGAEDGSPVTGYHGP